MHSLLINNNTFPKILCSHDTNENMQEPFDHNTANAQNAYSTALYRKTRSEVSMMHTIREKNTRERYERKIREKPSHIFSAFQMQTHNTTSSDKHQKHNT